MQQLCRLSKAEALLPELATHLYVMEEALPMRREKVKAVLGGRMRHADPDPRCHHAPVHSAYGLAGLVYAAGADHQAVNQALIGMVNE